MTNTTIKLPSALEQIHALALQCRAAKAAKYAKLTTREADAKERMYQCLVAAKTLRITQFTISNAIKKLTIALPDKGARATMAAMSKAGLLEYMCDAESTSGRIGLYEITPEGEKFFEEWAQFRAQYIVLSAQCSAPLASPVSTSSINK